MAALRAEMEASGGDRARQAMLAYEIGRTLEDGGGGEAAAVREYLGAYNLDPSFRPPLFELVRMFERRRSFKNLARLYEAELKSATTPAEKSSAIVDRASLLEDHLAQGELAGPLFEQASAEDPEGVTALLMLERRARVAGDAAAALTALEGLASRTKTPALRAILMIELAREKERAGDVDGAVETLRDAIRTSPDERQRALRALEEVARKHGRAPELVAALEARAALSASSDSADPANHDEAIAAFLEAARVRLDRLGDAEGARNTIDRALALAPDEPALRRAHMLASESASDLAASAADAAALQALVGEDRIVAAFMLREAEAAQANGDVAAARSALDRALMAEPGSAVLRAMHDDLSLALGEIDAVVARLEADAATAEPEAKAALLARAGSFAANVAGDAPRAAALIVRAAEASRDPTPILRELLAVGLTLHHAATTSDAITRLLAVSDDPEEKAALHHARYSALLAAGASTEDVKVALDTAVADGAPWAITALRILAASDGDHERLAHAHALLAERTADNDTGAAHLVASARALARADRYDDAVAALRKALERAPAHRYAVALLEEIYRRKGDANAVVRILAEAAEADTTGRAREAQLLVAGAAAEGAGDLALAAKTYQSALDRDPKALAPLLALRALAEKRGDAAAEVKTIAALAEHELASGGAGRFNLELGEYHRDVSTDPSLAVAPLRAALEAKETRAAAALALALMAVPPKTEPASRVEALTTLLGISTDHARIAFAHELLGEAIAGRDAALAAKLAAMLEPDGSDTVDVMVRLAAARLTSGDPGKLADRARAVEALANALGDAPEVAAELLLHASRVEMLVSNADNDAVLRAADIADRAPGSLVAALAAVEALGDEDDIGERASALVLWAPHTSGVVQRSIQAGAARLLALAGRSEEALPILRDIFESEPTDLASAEMMRVAARDEQSWPDIVRACDRLAEASEGELQAQLLEEASAILMDHMEQDEAAEPRLRAALALDPARPIAYARLHDVLADRGDEPGVLALVTARIEVTDDPVDLAPLFYEQARLHRSNGDYEGAFASLENLLLLESEHLGGLALLVELHVQSEQFAEAVDALRQIATAEGVPASQRRIARLGAADFLDKKLDDARGALAELRQIEDLGLADRALYERVAKLAERLGDLDRASDALERGAEVERDPTKKAAVERRLAKLEMESRGRREHALAAYRRAIRAQPTDLESLRGASVLISEASERRVLTEGPEAAFRAQLDKEPLDEKALRALAAVADARGDRALGTSVTRVLVASGLANDDERAQNDGEVVRAPAATPGLSDAGFATLMTEPLAPAAAGAVGEIVLAAIETLTEADRLEPSTFGLGRNDVGKPGTALVDEVLAIAAKFGAPAGDVWVGGRDPNLVTVIPVYKGKPAWIVGSNAASIAPADRRFRIGVLAAGLRLGVGPLALRVLAGGSDEVATQLFGTCVAGGAPLAASEGRAGLADATRILAKAIGRRARRAVTEAVPRVGDGGRPLLGWARALTITLARVGALAASDPSPSVMLAQVERGAAGALDTRSVARFWVAESTLALRRELGLAST